MIVLLNQAQLNAILPRVGELHRQVLTDPEWRTKAGGRSHRHDLPAIAWRQILDAMLAQVYGPLGGRKASDAAYTACARIQQGLMRLEHHPALKGQAAVEVSAEVIPCFSAGIGEGFSVYPETRSFHLLRPMPFVERGWRLTRWYMDDSRREGESRTFDPESHYLFTRHPSPA